MDLRLAQYLEEVFDRSYRPGQWDCVLMVAEWADRTTGSDFAGKLRGTYRSHFEGLRQWAKLGIGEAVRLTLTAAGWTEIEPAAAQAGDIVITDLDHPGIWDGERIVCAARGAAGRTLLHKRHARLALRAPEGEGGRP